MRDNVKLFVECFSKVFCPPEPIFEIGSLQVPGQIGYADLRPFFAGKIYVGCDTREGPGVDQIENVEQLTLENETAGTIVMMDTLEHVENPHKAVDEICRVIRNGGMVIMTSPQNFPIHDYPRDFWRFTPEGFAFLLRKFPTVVIGAQGDILNPHTVFGIGFKGEVDEKLFTDFVSCLSKALSAQPLRKKTLSLVKLILGSGSPEELVFSFNKNQVCVKTFRMHVKS